MSKRQFPHHALPAPVAVVEFYLDGGRLQSTMPPAAAQLGVEVTYISGEVYEFVGHDSQDCATSLRQFVTANRGVRGGLRANHYEADKVDAMVAALQRGELVSVVLYQPHAPNGYRKLAAAFRRNYRAISSK